MDAKTYWNHRYGGGQLKEGNTSGYGSYGEQLAKKLEWLKWLDIKSITDIGCGDFNFGKELLKIYPNATYTGQDISEVIIEKNKKDYPQYEFINTFNLPRPDLLLCIDVLFHIIDDNEYDTMLADIEEGWTKYLAITAYERNGETNETGSHIKIRKFDPERFGTPIIREVVEEDGQLYFYLFKRPDPIKFENISACLITKDHEYPQRILDEVNKFNFGEVLVLTDSDSPYRKYELFAKAKNELIYYQDDDAICAIKELVEKSKPNMINVGMKISHFESYKDKRMTMGLGWGSIFPKRVLKALDLYKNKYGEDELFKRDTEKILTHLVYPQNRMILPVEDLPSAYNPDRLWRQPEHWSNMDLIVERCKVL